MKELSWTTTRIIFILNVVTHTHSALVHARAPHQAFAQAQAFFCNSICHAFMTHSRRTRMNVSVAVAVTVDAQSTHIQIEWFKLVANYRLYQNTINVMHKFHGQYANTFCLAAFILTVEAFQFYSMLSKFTKERDRHHWMMRTAWMNSSRLCEWWKGVNYYMLNWLQPSADTTWLYIAWNISTAQIVRFHLNTTNLTIQIMCIR